MSHRMNVWKISMSFLLLTLDIHSSGKYHIVSDHISCKNGWHCWILQDQWDKQLPHCSLQLPLWHTCLPRLRLIACWIVLASAFSLLRMGMSDSLMTWSLLLLLMMVLNLMALWCKVVCKKLIKTCFVNKIVKGTLKLLGQSSQISKWYNQLSSRSSILPCLILLPSKILIRHNIAFLKVTTDIHDFLIRISADVSTEVLSFFGKSMGNFLMNHCHLLEWADYISSNQQS